MTYPCMLRDFCLDECNRIWLASWLNPPISFIHAVLILDSCNRGTRFSHVPEVRLLLWGAFCCCMLIFCCCMPGSFGCMRAWLMIFGLFPCAGVLWLDACYRSSFPRSDLHLQAAAAEFSQDQNLFSPLLPNGKPDRSENFWACSYHHDAPPIAKSWSMDAQILRKMENSWRFQRSISQKPCIEISWNCLGRLLSLMCISPWNMFWNGRTDMEKMKKWLMVMEANFLETVHQNWLKLLRHVAITPVQFPIKRFFKWMHGFQVMEETNSILCVFSSRHFAVLLHGKKIELGLWCRHGDDGGGVWKVQEDSWTVAEATMFAKPTFWNPCLASYNFYRNFL